MNFKASPGSVSFDYRSVAEAYRMVKDSQAPVIIPSEGAECPLAQLSVEAISSGRIARELQPFTVQIPARDRGVLRQNGKGDF